MFQVIREELVLIAFVWGPLVNGGIRKGTHANVGVCKGFARVIVNFTTSRTFFDNPKDQIQQHMSVSPGPNQIPTSEALLLYHCHHQLR